MRVALSAGFTFLVLAALSRATPVKAEATVSQAFEGWTATCDNLRDCVVIGSSDDGDGLFYVRVARNASVSAAPKIKAVFAASDPIPGAPGALQLTANATARGTKQAFTVAATKDDPDGAALAADIQDVAFLSTIEVAETLDYVVGTLKGRLVLKGLPSALRFIDEHQGRLGTPSALVARGQTPISQVPPPPEPPMVQPANSIVAAVIPTLSRALLAMAKPACDPEVVEVHSDAAAWILGADRWLVALPCAESPDNVSVALFTTDAKGEQPRPAMLEEPPKQGADVAENVIANYDFDVKTLTLTSLDKGRGLGDCGTMRVWVWTGDIFALLKASELKACPGALPEDWPPIYQARRR